MGLHQTKQFMHNERNCQRKSWPTEWKKIFANDVYDIFANENPIIFNIHKHIHSTSKNPNNPIKKRGEDLKRYFSKEDIEMANIHKSYDQSR